MAVPVLIIGQSGVEIEKVKKEVSKLVNEYVQISVVEIIFEGLEVSNFETEVVISSTKVPN